MAIRVLLVVLLLAGLGSPPARASVEACAAGAEGARIGIGSHGHTHVWLCDGDIDPGTYAFSLDWEPGSTGRFVFQVVHRTTYEPLALAVCTVAGGALVEPCQTAGDIASVGWDTFGPAGTGFALNTGGYLEVWIESIGVSLAEVWAGAWTFDLSG